MPAYKTPQRFPGSQRLPELAQTLIQRFFPPDELPVPAMAGIGPKLVQRLEQVVPPRVGADRANPFLSGPRSQETLQKLLDSFRPWNKGLEQAYPEMYGPSTVPEMPEAFRQLLSQVKKPM